MSPHVHRDSGESKRRLAAAFGLTSLILVVEVVGGFLTGSLALLADAGHMLTDVAGLGLALFAIKFAERPATPERTYGYYRVEILAALANAVLLFGVSVYILLEVWQRLRHPPVVATGAMMAVAALGTAVNAAAIFVLRAGASHSLNVKGAYFEVLSDLFSSVGVLVAGAVMWTTGWYYADPILSAEIGLFILPRTWKLLREAVGVLLEGTPADVNLAAVREAIEGLPGVEDVHDLHVWTLTSGMNAMSLHVTRADGAVHQSVLAAVQRRVTGALPVTHVTVQVEDKGCAAGEAHL